MDKFSQIPEKIPVPYLSEVELSILISGTDYSRYGLVKRALARGDLIHLRRGLYYLGKRYDQKPTNLFAIAQHLYGPSYISFESALNFHGWIPESVHTVYAASLKRSKKFETPLGIFQYHSIHSHPFFAGVRRITTDKDSFFLAEPWKALADYVVLYKKDWQGLHPLIHSLRIEEDVLQATTSEQLREVEEAHTSRRARRFFKGIRKELSL